MVKYKQKKKIATIFNPSNRFDMDDALPRVIFVYVDLLRSCWANDGVAFYHRYKQQQVVVEAIWCIGSMLCGDVDWY